MTELSLAARVAADARCAAAAWLAGGALEPGAGVRELLHEPSPAMWTAAFAWAAAFTNAAAPPAPTPLPLGGSDLRPHVRLRCGVAADAPAVLHFVRELAAYEREPDAVAISESTLTRDGLPARGLEDVAALAAAPPQFYVLLAELPAAAAASLVGDGSDGGGSGDWALPPPSGDGWVPVAVALAHPSYSTWTGRTLYLEDLYVSPPGRRRGVSKHLFAALARAALVARCARLQWSVLTWNAPAVRAYDGMRALRLEDWRLYRACADGGGLARLAHGGEAHGDEAVGNEAIVEPKAGR